SAEDIQAPPTPDADRPAAAGADFIAQNAVLEVEPFQTLRHVTLRWDPPDSPLRPVIESELDRRLRVLGSPYHDTGTVLTLIGYGLLALALLAGFTLVLRMYL